MNGYRFKNGTMSCQMEKCFQCKNIEAHINKNINIEQYHNFTRMQEKSNEKKATPNQTIELKRKNSDICHVVSTSLSSLEMRLNELAI